MLKNIPFGYVYVYGKIATDSEESCIVKEVFEMCISGRSLSNISLVIREKYHRQELNKSKINRIIHDVRYLDNEKYPQIITRGIFETANNLKKMGDTKKEIEEKSLALNITIPVICPCCGARMKRFHDSRRSCPDWWKCRNSDCQNLIHFRDSDLLDELKIQVSQIQASEDIGNDRVRKSFATARMEKDVLEGIEIGAFDKEKIRGDILLLASMKYDDVSEIAYEKRKLSECIKSGRADFIRVLNEFGQKILMSDNQTIMLILKDNTEIRRHIEDEHSCTRKDDKVYSGNEESVG